MDFSAALTAAKAGKTISRPSLPDVVLVWVTSPHAGTTPQLARLFPTGAVSGYQIAPGDQAATDWVAA